MCFCSFLFGVNGTGWSSSTETHVNGRTRQNHRDRLPRNAPTHWPVCAKQPDTTATCSHTHTYTVAKTLKVQHTQFFNSLEGDQVLAHRAVRTHTHTHSPLWANRDSKFDTLNWRWILEDVWGVLFISLWLSRRWICFKNWPVTDSHISDWISF